jgi:hypothetical protein
MNEERHHHQRDFVAGWAAIVHATGTKSQRKKSEE